MKYKFEASSDQLLTGGILKDLDIRVLFPFFKQQNVNVSPSDLIEYVGSWNDINERMDKWYIRDSNSNKIHTSIFCISESGNEKELIILNGKKKFGHYISPRPI